jgi:pilus assembly protein CpaC
MLTATAIVLGSFLVRAVLPATTGVTADSDERVFMTLEQGQVADLTFGSTQPNTAASIPPTTPPNNQARLVVEGLDGEGHLTLLVNRSVTLATVRPYKIVNVAQPELLTVNTIAAQSLLVTAKKPGTTQVVLWDENENSQVIDVTIHADLSALQDLLKKQLPGAAIEVSSGAAESVVLRGKVPDLQAARQAEELAAAFGKVVNLLEVCGGQQVMLQVRFMEVSRTALTALGVDISGSVSNGDFSIGLSGQNRLPVGDRGLTLSGSGAWGDFSFEAFIDALKRNSLARVLAEPNLTVISGEEGDFLAGGEVPIPVPQSGTGGAATITIEYKEFGIRLRCTPVVLGDGRIRMKVAPEVSELDYANGTSVGGQTVPGLRTRKVNTVVEMSDGQTFMLAGLISRRVDARNQGTPGLSSLPVLGTLFRSVRYERNETELVILVTPRLVEPMNPEQVPALPGQKWRYPNEVDFLFNSDLGGPVKDQANVNQRGGATNAAPPRFVGRHGFAPDPTDPSASADHGNE